MTIKFDYALIDGDPYVYSCGFAVQKYDKETDIITCEPIKHAFYNVNHSIKKVIHDVGATNYKLFLTGKNNFRHSIYPYYKENRVKCVEKCEHPYDCEHEKTDNKPVYYKQIIEYMLKRWNAIITEGQEADDQVSIEHCSLHPFGFEEDNYSSVIVSIDKDFNTIPGYKYNPKTQLLTYTTETQALRNFYLQILTGDVSDNIPRLKKGWRKAKLEKKLQDVEEEYKMYSLLLEEYKEIYPSSMKEEADNFITRNGRLVWLRREKDQQWGIPEVQS